MFTENQQVGCLVHGKGKVEMKFTDAIRVSFDSGKYAIYSLDGKFLGNTSSHRVLYPLEEYKEIQEMIGAKVPYVWEPKKDEWCWFYDHTGKTILAQFSGRTEMHSPLKCYYTHAGDYYPYVAKFEGPLPEHLTKPLPNAFLHKKPK